MVHLNPRTCVGCRQPDDPSNLLRFVLVDGVLTCDDNRKAPGRGAWLHENPQCLAAAHARQGFARSFRSGVDDSILTELLEQWQI